MSEKIQSPSWKTWAGTVAAIAAVVIVLIVFLTFQSRQQIRQQILNRDAQVLSAVATMLQSDHDGLSAPDDLEIALQTSRLRGVLAVRIFDPGGEFTLAIPVEVSEGELLSADHQLLLQGEPVAHFHPEADFETIFDLHDNEAPMGTSPLQEIFVPLHQEGSENLIGIVQYLIDGKPVREEFAALDSTLLRQTGTALALGLTGLILGATVAFIRLRRSHLALAQQTRRLLQANKELSLAARTSAVGAISAHLIHGIRSPLASLDILVRTHDPKRSLPEESVENWRHIADATNRIRSLVDDVVEVLREQDMTTSFQLSQGDLESVLQEKLLAKATAAEVRFETRREGEGQLSGHAANIILLILVNLCDNAIALTPKGKRVWVELVRRDRNLVFEVGDEGPGIPEDRQPLLFTPGNSGRSGGTGLGLAISQRLAADLNASLQLARSSSSGTVFSLRYPIPDEEADPPADQDLVADPSSGR